MTIKKEKTLLDRLLSHRNVYFLLALFVIYPLIVPMGLPITVGPEVANYYQQLTTLTEDDIVLISITAEFSAWNELSAGTTATCKLIIDKGAKLVFIEGHPEATGIVKVLYESLDSYMAERDYKYWEDTIDLGYLFTDQSAYASAASDFHGLVKTDFELTSIEGSFLDGIHTGEDWTFLFSVAGGGVDNSILNHFRLRYGTRYMPIVIGMGVPGCKAAQSAGQIEGYLASLRGGAELEQLIQSPGTGLQAMDAFTLAHYMLLVLVLIGNIGYLTGSGSDRR